MALAGLAEAVLGITGVIFGDYGTATVSRPHDLRGSDGIVVNNLELAANVSTGTTTLSLRLPSAATGFGGKAPYGILLTIAGAPYAVTARASVSGGVLPVTISPGLAASALAGASVAVAPASVFSLPQTKRQDLRIATVPPALVGAVQFVLLVIQAVAPAGYAPEVGDVITEASGRRGRVEHLGRDSAGVWELLCGGGA